MAIGYSRNMLEKTHIFGYVKLVVKYIYLDILHL